MWHEPRCRRQSCLLEDRSEHSRCAESPFLTQVDDMLELTEMSAVDGTSQ